jgi:hypothetical protein
MTVASTAISATGTLAEGKAAERKSEYEAQQLDQSAKAKEAQGTREAAETLRQSRIRSSDIQAQMAAGGGGVSVEQIAKSEEVGQYNALASLYERRTEAQGIRAKAGAARYEGKVAKRASKVKALSTIISGGTKAYQSYKG